MMYIKLKVILIDIPEKNTSDRLIVVEQKFDCRLTKNKYSSQILGNNERL